MFTAKPFSSPPKSKVLLTLTYFALKQYYRYSGYAAIKRKIDEDQKNFLVGSAW